MKKIQDIDVYHKKVLVRVDYNVPIKNGKVTNNDRLRASLETINYLSERKAVIVLCSHLGRPDGKLDQQYSLKAAAEELNKLNNNNVQFIDDCIGKNKEELISKITPGKIVLLENLRFYAGEERNEPIFAKKLANGCDIYVNDAFSASHRKHASIVGVTDYLPSYAGLQLQKEVKSLSSILIDPKKPFVLVMGGAKIADKIPLIGNMIPKIETLILGGAIANTFLLTKGYQIGKSIIEPEAKNSVEKVFSQAKKNKVKIMLPEDCVVANNLKASKGQEREVNKIKENEIILDVGENSINQYIDKLKSAKTIFWNGPMGYTENKTFAHGTRAIAQAIAKSKAFTVIGGGDTITAVDDNVKKQFDYVSMAGGAALEFLSGKSLPGIKVLE